MPETRTRTYGVAFDYDPDDPNPHPWTLAAARFDSHADAEAYADSLSEAGTDPVGWTTVELSEPTGLIAQGRAFYEALEAAMETAKRRLASEDEREAWDEEFGDALDRAFDNIDHILAHLEPEPEEVTQA